MNARQIAVILLGGSICVACLTALLVPHPEWRSLEHEYHLPGQVILWAAPMELLSFVLLVLTPLATLALALAFSDKRQD